MSAPSLPDTFGNYALSDFVEVVSPSTISWLPQTAGWWWLGGVLLAVLVYRTWQLLRHWYRNRYRREALQRLHQLAGNNDSGSLVAEINRLLKLTALAAYSREQVARLTGEDWVTFLNSQCSAAPFSPEQRQLLSLGAYQTLAIDGGEKQRLIAACSNWICEHAGPLDD